MASVACTASRPAVATRAMAGAQQQARAISKPCTARTLLPARPAPRAQRRSVQPQASAMELAQLAESEAGFIFGVSGVMFGITLIGLAIGFVLLRVESLAEEGKI